MNKRQTSLALGLILMLLAWQGIFPRNVKAVVNDLTLTGVPPNTVVKLTNETGEAEEKRTDDKGGIIVIPLEHRKWEGGSYTITITEEGGKQNSQPFLASFSNRKCLFAFPILYACRSPKHRQARRLEISPKDLSAVSWAGCWAAAVAEEAMARLCRYDLPIRSKL